MKPITKIYAYKNMRTGELCGKLFVKKPTSETYQSYQRSLGDYELVECVVKEKTLSNCFTVTGQFTIDNVCKVCGCLYSGDKCPNGCKEE